MYGTIAEETDGSSCAVYTFMYCFLSLNTAPCYVHHGTRLHLRKRYNLEEDVNDWVATSVFSRCALCQEARELKHRRVGEGITLKVP